jgi:hypothetical protein
MPYVRLDEQKEHFGPAWVRLDFAIIVTVSGFSSFLTNISGRTFRCISTIGDRLELHNRI